jgi:hypothetical protein
MDRHAAGDGLGRDLDQALGLVVVERQALAGGGGEDQPVDRRLQEMADQLYERGLVEAAILERRDQRNPESLEAGWG